MDTSELEDFQDQILRYLRNTHYNDVEEGGPLPHIPSSLSFIQRLIEDLFKRVGKHSAWRERYKQLRKEHNQDVLFDIMQFVEDYCMDEEIVNKITFPENLVISSLDNVLVSKESLNPVGGMSINVQWVEGKSPRNPIKDCDAFDKDLMERCRQIKEYIAKVEAESMSDHEKHLAKQVDDLEAALLERMHNQQHKFLVHVSSRFYCGHEGGSEVTSWVDRDFHTVEEKRKEYEVKEGRTDTKTLYVGLQKDKYYWRHTSTTEDENVDDRQYYSTVKMQNYVSEGANLVLMRYLVVARHLGPFELAAMYINGELCRNIYESRGPRVIYLHGKRMEAYKIYRTIIESCGLSHRISTIFTTHGRIISQEWEGSKYVLNINPKLVLDSKLLPKFEMIPLETTWMDDLELFSKYADYKTEAELKLKTYMSDHPEIKAIIADYMQHVLLLKPSKVVEFSCEYFKKLAPVNEYHHTTAFQDDDNDDINFYRTL